MIESIRTSTGRVSVVAFEETIRIELSVNGLKGASMEIEITSEQAGILLHALNRAMEVVKT